jgi:hypothetical protein
MLFRSAVASPILLQSQTPRVGLAASERSPIWVSMSGAAIEGTTIDAVFIGSCTNGRLEDLRAAAAIVMGRKVAPGVKAIVVPGSGLIGRQAEEEGLAEIFRSAGFEWRAAGCSMCVAMNGDRLEPGQRCASTSNRNFEGRQGVGGRTHLMSPAMAAAAAVTGCLTDVRKLVRSRGMKPFTTIESVAAYLPATNIDTDIIFPSSVSPAARPRRSRSVSVPRPPLCQRRVRRSPISCSTSHPSTRQKS